MRCVWRSGAFYWHFAIVPTGPCCSQLASTGRAGSQSKCHVLLQAVEERLAKLVHALNDISGEDDPFALFAAACRDLYPDLTHIRHASSTLMRLSQQRSLSGGRMRCELRLSGAGVAPLAIGVSNRNRIGAAGSVPRPRTALQRVFWILSMQARRPADDSSLSARAVSLSSRRQARRARQTPRRRLQEAARPAARMRLAQRRVAPPQLAAAARPPQSRLRPARAARAPHGRRARSRRLQRPTPRWTGATRAPSLLMRSAGPP